MRKKEEIERDFRETYEREFGRTLELPVKYNPRLTGALARVTYEKRTKKLVALEYSKNLFKDTESDYWDVVRHELIHVMLIAEQQETGHGEAFLREAQARGVACEGYKGQRRLTKGQKHECTCVLCGAVLLRGTNKAKLHRFAKQYGYILCGCTDEEVCIELPAVVRNPKGLQQYTWKFQEGVIGIARANYWGNTERVEVTQREAKEAGIELVQNSNQKGRTE